jgi:hypothetical protein
MGPSRGWIDPDHMDLISIAIAVVAFVGFYFLIDGLDRV